MSFNAYSKNRNWNAQNQWRKKELIHKVTEVVTDVLREPKSNCMVILVEISEENWGVGGLTLKEQKEKYDGKEWRILFF